MPKVTRSEIDLFRSELGLNPIHESQELQELDNKVEDLRLEGYKVRDGDLSILEGVETRPVSRVQQILDETAEIDKQSQEKQSRREQFILTHPDKYKQLVSTEKSVLEEKPEIQEAVIDSFMRESEPEVAEKKEEDSFTGSFSREFKKFTKYDVPAVAGSMMQWLGSTSPTEDKRKFSQKAGGYITEPGISEEEALKKTLDSSMFKRGAEIVANARAAMEADESIALPEDYEEIGWSNFYTPEKLGEILGGLVPQMLATMGVSLGTAYATRNPHAAIAAGFSVSAILEGGLAYEEALKYTEDPITASKVGSLVGSVNGVLEMLPASKLMNKLGLGDMVTREMTRRVLERGLYKNIGAGAVSQGLIESVTEMGQELNSALAEIGYQEGDDIQATKDALGKRLLVSGWAGLLGGTVIGGPTGAVQHSQAKETTDGIIKKINDDETIPFNIEYDEESTGEIVRPESWYRAKHYNPEQFTEVKEGEEGYDSESNERQFRSHRTGFNEKTETGEWRAVLNPKAGRDTVAEEVVEIFFRKAETENPELAGQIRAYVRDLRSSLEEAGYEVGFDDIELWSSAYTYNVLGYTHDNLESAWMYSVPQEMVNAFDAFMGSAKDGTAVADIIRGDAKLVEQAFNEEESEAIAGQAIDEGVSERGPPVEGKSTQLLAAQFVSPNTEDLTLNRALQEIHSGRQADFVRFEDELDREFGRDGSHLYSIGEWATGAENSTYRKFAQPITNDELNYLAAIKGLVGNQKTGLNFNTSGEGDALYKIKIPAAERIDDVIKSLDSHGIEFKTIGLEKDYGELLIYDESKSHRDNVERIGLYYGKDVEEYNGKGWFLGDWESRGRADTRYVEEIKSYEESNPHRKSQKLREGISVFRPDLDEGRLNQLKPTFFSAAGKAAENFPSKMNALSVKNWLRKQPNIKQEEIEWLDIESFLKGKKSVSREELQDWINAHEIKVEETQKFDGDKGYMVVNRQTGEAYNNHANYSQALESVEHLKNEWNIDAEVQSTGGTTQYEEYVLPGGTKYSELLLRMPNNIFNWALDYGDGQYDVLDWEGKVRGTFATKEEAKSFIEELGATDEKTYSSPHFTEPNILAHIRFNKRVDPEGNNVLFIEEIQSDWHQAGAQEGYAKEPYKRKYSQQEIQEIHKDIVKNIKKIGKELGVDDFAPFLGMYELSSQYKETGEYPPDVVRRAVNEAYTDERISEIDRVLLYAQSNKLHDVEHDRLDAVQDRLEMNMQVPNAPFKGDGWLHLSLKRMLRYAAENGYDKIAWTTGAQQVERYENATRARVDQIHWQRGKAFSADMSRYLDEEAIAKAEETHIIVNGIKDDRSVGTFTIPVNGSTWLNGKDVTLEGLLGKNIASQIRESDKRSGTIEGGDLTIGGEGMKLWYDRKIPSFLKKYGKKWGIEVRNIAIPNEAEFKVRPEIIDKWFDKRFPSGRASYRKEWHNRFEDGAEEAYKQMDGDSRAIWEKIVDPEILKSNPTSTQQSIEITPQMEASVMEGQPLFQLKNIELTEEDAKNLLIRKIVDKMRPLQMLQEDIEEKHGKLSDAEDAYMHSELFIGKADEQIKGFLKRTIDVDNKDSFLSRLNAAEIKLDDLGDYLHAMHAAERNAQTGKKKGSGMSDSEADAIIKELGKIKGIKQFAREARKIADEALKVRLKAGLIDKDTYKRLKATYKHYVPLFRVMDTDEAMFSTGKGFSVTGADIKKAVGSEREVINPFVNLIAQYEEAVIRAEKNRVGQALLKLLEKHKSDAWEVKSRSFVPQYNKEGELQFMSPKINEEVKADAVVVKVKGKVKVIKFKGEQGARVANAMKGVGVMRAVPIINNFNNYLRLVSTTVNPEFLVTNLFRDVQTAGIHVGGEFGKKELKAAMNLKNITSAIRGIYRNTTDKMDSEWAEWYEDMKKHGGRMGWFEQDSLQDKLKKMEKNLARVDKSGKGVKLAGHALAKFVNNANESVESAVRLTLYRGLVENGTSRKRAAQAAKNITVNFNRKGEIGSFINSIYLFSNATIQGGYRIAWSLAKSKRTQKIAAGIVALGFLESFFNAMVGDDEYEKLNDWTKDNNWVFMLPSGNHIKIRVPYGYNIFKTMGNLAAESIREQDELGRINYGDKFARILGAFDSAFNPFSGATFGQALSPTALDWAVQIGENKNFMGAPIMPDNFFPPYKADVERKFSTARTRSVEFAEGLFELGGGEIFRDDEGNITQAIRGPLSWLTDVSPETVDHMIDFLGSGAGKFVSNSINTGVNIAEGKDFQVENAPYLRLFYGKPSEYSELGLINKYRKEMSRYRFNDIESEKFKRYLKDALDKEVIDGKRFNKYWTDFDKAQAKLRANPSSAKRYTVTIDGVEY